MSKLKLTDVEWEGFDLIDIFDIKDGYYNKKPPLDKDGTIPFLGATPFIEKKLLKIGIKLATYLQKMFI